MPRFRRKEARGWRVFLRSPRTTNRITEEAMKWRHLFGGTKGTAAAASAKPSKSAVASMKIDLDALEDCVGGKPESEGVGCYVQSTQPHAH
jgi:hypothetical protein